MANTEWMAQRLNGVMRQARMEDKAQENLRKPPLNSPDVCQTKDYIFSPITPGNRTGDSGQLLLAKKKSDRSQRYLIKHEFTDSAANEFVYTKLAQAMDIKMPNAVLFQLSKDEKRPYFHAEYILGTEFLNLKIEDPTYQQIREQATNWQDYFRYQAMYTMFCEGDGLEILFADDEYIYRVDTTDAFLLDNTILSQAGVNRTAGGINLKDAVKQYVNTYDYAAYWKRCDFESDLQRCVKQYGNECIVPYLEPLSRIQEIPDHTIDGFLNTLCYFYPDFIGDYFKRYIATLQEHCAEYLKGKTTSQLIQRI